MDKHDAKGLYLVLCGDNPPRYPLRTIAAEERLRVPYMDDVYRIPGRAAQIDDRGLCLPEDAFRMLRDFGRDASRVKDIFLSFAREHRLLHGHVIYGPATQARILAVFAGQGEASAEAWAYYAYAAVPQDHPLARERKARLLAVELGPGLAPEHKTDLADRIKRTHAGFKVYKHPPGKAAPAPQPL